MRTDTVAAWAGTASATATTRPASAPGTNFFMSQPLSARAFTMASVGGRSPGSRADPLAPSRTARRSSGSETRGFPGHSGGSAPESHRLPEPPTLISGGCYRPEQAMTVNLTRIYTRLGDDGETHLGDMSRVPKTHPRIEAYGTVDELNSQLGVTLALAGLDERFAAFLRRIQNDLFDVGADISVPHTSSGTGGGERAR